jgi:hypothetical protein
MANAILGLGHTKTGPKIFTTSIIGSVQPELGLKMSMTTTIIRVHPTINRPYTFYDANNIGLHPTLIRPKTNL